MQIQRYILRGGLDSGRDGEIKRGRQPALGSEELMGRRMKRGTEQLSDVAMKFGNVYLHQLPPCKPRVKGG